MASIVTTTTLLPVRLPTVISIENGAFRPAVLDLTESDSGVISFTNEDDLEYEIIALDGDFEPFSLGPGETFVLDFYELERKVIRYRTTLGVQTIPGLVDTRGLGEGPRPEVAEGDLPQAEVPESGTVVVGDREITLVDFGCLEERFFDGPKLLGFGTDQNGVHYAVEVRDRTVTTWTMDGFFGGSRFLVSWDDAVATGSGTFGVGSGRTAGGINADCGTISPWTESVVEAEDGSLLDTEADLFCITGADGAVFVAPALALFGASVSGDGLTSLATFLGLEDDLISQLVESGDAFEVLVSSAASLLPPFSLTTVTPDDGRFSIAISSSRVEASVTVDTDHLIERLRANPRLSARAVDQLLDQLAGRPSVSFGFVGQCALAIEAPGDLTVTAFELRPIPGQ
jgi:hypothetical protein